MRKSAHDRNRCGSTETHGLAATIIAALLAMVGMTSFAKDASDGLIAWWRVESKPNGTVFTKDGLLDHVHAGVEAAGVNHATASDTYPAVPVCHTNIDLTYPMGSGTIPNAPCVYLPQPTNVSPTTGNYVANRQNISLPLNDVDLSDKPSTYIIRFCPDSGLYASRAQATVFSYDWSSSTGIKLVLSGQGSTRWASPLVYFGGTMTFNHTDITLDVGSGIWYDLGVVVEPNAPEAGQSRITVYCCQGNGLTNQGAEGNKTLSVTGTVSRVAGYGALSSRRLRLGSTAGATTWGGLDSSETLSSLLIHQVKVYDRALSIPEFEQACAPSTDPIFTVGTKNGSLEEFSDTSAVAVYDPATMPWRNLRRNLTAENPSLSISATLNAADLNVPRVLEFSPVYSMDCPADACIDVLINGTQIGAVARNATEDRLVYVSEKKLKALLVLSDGAYPLVLTLRRSGGMAGSVGFDRISFGGGWQLGVKDRSYSEFRTWDGKKYYNFYRYFLARNDLKLFSGQMFTASSDQHMDEQTICFSISDALAANGAFVFRTNPLGSGTVEYYLNGELFCTKTTTYNVDYELEMPNGTLKGGINELKAHWKTLTSSGSSGFDYFRLSPKKFAKGTLIVLK